MKDLLQVDAAIIDKLGRIREVSRFRVDLARRADADGAVAAELGRLLFQNLFQDGDDLPEDILRNIHAAVDHAAADDLHLHVGHADDQVVVRQIDRRNKTVIGIEFVKDLRTALALLAGQLGRADHADVQKTSDDGGRRRVAQPRHARDVRTRIHGSVPEKTVDKLLMFEFDLILIADAQLLSHAAFPLSRKKVYFY